MQLTSVSTLSRGMAAWFALDAVLVLAPPMHWAVSDHTSSVFGIPASLCYFLTVSALTTLSVVAAYRRDARQR